MTPDNALLDRLVADLQPVRPQRARRGWGWLALAIMATLLVVHVAFGLKPGAAWTAAGVWFVLTEIVLFALGLASAWAVIGMVNPTRDAGRPALWLALAAVVPVLAVVSIITSLVASDMAPHEPEHWSCALWGTISGTLVAVALSRWLRRGAPASPARAGLCIGVAAGSLGSAIYGLTCPVHGFEHWSIWHFAPVLVCALAGRGLLPHLLRW